MDGVVKQMNALRNQGRGNSDRSLQFGAFTLVEMMVVVAIMGLLAGILIPVIASARNKGHQAACQNNLRQISLALELYRADFQDQFPGPGSKSTYGPQPEDWIWWQYGRGVTNSAIALYIEGIDPRIVTCPMDREARTMQGEGILPGDPYRYSYALTSYDMRNGENPGMATIITQNREVHPFRMSKILRPEAKLMLVEEARETIDDPRWVPEHSITNKVTERHGRRGNVVFADGHIETVTPGFGFNPTNSMPGL